ncbi:MAG: hypothetical protein KAF42_03710 [Sphingopyxis terrae]|uniref:GDT1 family protein n=1 Tax=Sphingopyxis terrae subsp. terrae NBRC 15098 TaxID=1219058 RepID=A0A142VYS8_9SPHN|nr:MULTISPECIES: hypothetical protein [Sphingopyxis]AMU94944.1 hypothetical protein AOA14_10040 [Sphingopyxis terrae subsp. terrae NBRC 15098]MBU7588302.1 hypothetical protein [Sphingopyxis terrae]
MDAIMLALVAVLLANADGRTGRLLSQVMAARGDRRAVVAIAFAAFLANATIAAVAGTAANRVIGQGIVALLLAFALLGAAVALVWRGRLGPAVQSLEEAPLPSLAARLFLAQLGDRSHFLIGALAATSGAGLWAAAGGLIGWTLSLVPFLAFGAALADQAAARIARLMSAAILTLWGLNAAMRAFGL